jgi:plasmid stability protein
MIPFTVRDIEEEMACALQNRAAANGRSLEAEHLMILREALTSASTPVEDFAAAAARLRVKLRHEGDSTDILRAARDGTAAVARPLLGRRAAVDPDE